MCNPVQMPAASPTERPKNRTTRTISLNGKGKGYIDIRFTTGIQYIAFTDAGCIFIRLVPEHNPKLNITGFPGLKTCNQTNGIAVFIKVSIRNPVLCAGQKVK